MQRLFSTAAFAGAALAFLLPFGLVSSCDGAEVRFTGVELATFEVRADRGDEGLRDELEAHAGPFALLLLAAAFVGLILCALGASGGAQCAAVGVVLVQLLFYAIVATGDGSNFFVGYWAALGAFVTSAVAALITAVRARRHAGRSPWPLAGYAVAVILPPIGLVLAALGGLFAVGARSARRSLTARRATG
jgi:hypothetical protein